MLAETLSRHFVVIVTLAVAALLLAPAYGGFIT